MYHQHQCENHLCLLLLLRLFLSLIIMYELVHLVSLVNYISPCVRAKKRCDVQVWVRLVYLQCIINERGNLFFRSLLSGCLKSSFYWFNQIWIYMHGVVCKKTMFNLISSYVFVPYVIVNTILYKNVFYIRR